MFLPVPGNTLQSRFFRPYVIKKKLSDLNYKVTTPDRRKETQLCHINMLKPYVERDSFSEEAQPANVNVVISEEEPSCGFGRDSPTDTARLSNSVVLSDWIPSCLTCHKHRFS